MNNLLSYCGLVEVRINASEKDLPVCKKMESTQAYEKYDYIHMRGVKKKFGGRVGFPKSDVIK